jgi:hypothetical protein
LQYIHDTQPEMWRWSLEEICRIATAHAQDAGFRYVREEDLLRASGPLKVLGIELGPYVGKGYDCKSVFRFLDYEAYEAPIEIKTSSSGFKYQQKKYSAEELSRAVVLCMRNDLLNVPPNVDIIQLETLCSALAP